MSNIDELWRKKQFLRMAYRVNRFFSSLLMVAGIVLSFYQGWEVLVGSALVFLALSAAGVLFAGMIELAEWDYSQALYELEDET